ncbi:MAG: hypothetical protein H7247_09180 [Polaromonas sp.]|nr:hypothetical protein [Gemmatimonadaceae bacterium]
MPCASVPASREKPVSDGPEADGLLAAPEFWLPKVSFALLSIAISGDKSWTP